MAELKKLAEHCEFRDYREEALRDRLVCGLLNEAIQKRLLTQKDLTLREAVEIAQGMDTASREAKDMKAQFKTRVCKAPKQEITKSGHYAKGHYTTRFVTHEQELDSHEQECDSHEQDSTCPTACATGEWGMFTVVNTVQDKPSEINVELNINHNYHK